MNWLHQKFRALLGLTAVLIYLSQFFSVATVINRNHFWISTSSTRTFLLHYFKINTASPVIRITVTRTFAHENFHLISALQPLLTGPHDRNRQLNCSCPVTCASYIWRADIRVRNVNLVQTEIGFIAGAKRHNMKGFLSLQHTLHFHLILSSIPTVGLHQTVTWVHSRRTAPMVWLYGWSHARIYVGLI